MLRKIAAFYLFSLLFVFLITIYLGFRGATYVEVFSVAILGWPAAAFCMLAHSRAKRILAQTRMQSGQPHTGLHG